MTPFPRPQPFAGCWQHYAHVREDTHHYHGTRLPRQCHDPGGRPWAGAQRGPRRLPGRLRALPVRPGGAVDAAKARRPCSPPKWPGRGRGRSLTPMPAGPPLAGASQPAAQP